MKEPHLPSCWFDVKEPRAVKIVKTEHQLSVTSRIHVISLQRRHRSVGRKGVRYCDGVVEVIGEEKYGTVVVLVHDFHGDGDSGREWRFAQVAGQHGEFVPVDKTHRCGIDQSLQPTVSRLHQNVYPFLLLAKTDCLSHHFQHFS